MAPPRDTAFFVLAILSPYTLRIPYEYSTYESEHP